MLLVAFVVHTRLEELREDLMQHCCCMRFNLCCAVLSCCVPDRVLRAVVTGTAPRTSSPRCVCWGGQQQQQIEQQQQQIQKSQLKRVTSVHMQKRAGVLTIWVVTAAVVTKMASMSHSMWRSSLTPFAVNSALQHRPWPWQQQH
jgi:hypothetical protein